MLYIFGGLPGTGKTELAKGLASAIGAVYIRVDTIEQSLKECGLSQLYDEGYRVAFALALENLKNGLSVVADSTNLISESRQAWVNVAKNAATAYKEIEIVCSDKAEHRERVENRISDIPNLNLPSWHSVVSREYQPWLTVDITLDTAGKTPSQSQQALLSLLNSFTNTE